jgi:hypothetical protein
VLSQDLQPKVFEITVTIGAIDNEPNGPVNAFDKALGEAVLEIGEEFGPPVSQGLNKLEKKAVTGLFGFPDPGSYKISL